ncbi:MAG TPA: methyltransferase domain-containing protein [Allosphingosinicella sp.]|jgi:predicted SAM-dependent methyltransferase
MASSLRLARTLRSAAFGLINRLRRPLTRLQLRKYDKLHLGAGGYQLDGWANLDLVGRRNLIWDLTRPLPMPAHVKFVYSQHFIEHIPRDVALKLLRNAHASMAKDGVMRISTPDLRLFSQAYLSGEVPPLWTERNPCRFFNELMRNWGHTFLYDEEELTALLTEAGFRTVRRMKRNESDHAELRDLEIRPDQLDLIVEAQP